MPGKHDVLHVIALPKHEAAPLAHYAAILAALLLASRLLAQQHNNIQPLVGLCHIAAFAVCFVGIRRLVGRTPLPRNVLERRCGFYAFRWHNLLVSCGHAFVTGAWAIGCFVLYGDSMWSDMVHFVNRPTYLLACFSTGYFVHDSLDIVLAGRSAQKWEILLHHAAIICNALYTISTHECIGYQMLAMSIESQTAFLHLRKLLQMAACAPQSAIVRCNRAVNLCTFVPLRALPLVLLVKATFDDGHRVPAWLLLQFRLSMLVLCAVNAVLFWQLLRSDVLRGEFRLKKILVGNGRLTNGYVKCTEANGSCSR